MQNVLTPQSILSCAVVCAKCVDLFAHSIGHMHALVGEGTGQSEWLQIKLKPLQIFLNVCTLSYM